MKVKAVKQASGWRLYVEKDVAENGKTKKKHFYSGVLPFDIAAALVNNDDLTLEIEPDQECMRAVNFYLESAESEKPYPGSGVTKDKMKVLGEDK